MRFVVNMECTSEAQVVKSFSDAGRARIFVEGFCLDETISDRTWKQLLMGEKFSFFGDRTIEVEMVTE